ncbi:MAG: hypothetical protein ACE5LF_07135 [Alphaproteobacteria bacterium]
MRSPLAKVLVVVLGWPTVLLIVIVAYEWYLDEFYVPVVPPVSRERVQHPNYHPVAEEALARLDALPGAEREALLAGLRATIVPVATWLDGIDRAGFSLLCLGEDHDAHTRRFLADRVFPALRLDALHLETTRAGLADVERRLRLGRDYAPLLGADIAGILRAARQANPALAVTAIEVTEQQRKDRLRLDGGSREDSLVANLEAAYVSGGRNAVLLGALHCKDEAGRLYERIRRRLSPGVAERAVNLRILGEHQDGPLEAFVYFLDEVAVTPGDFALVDTDALPPMIQSWFQLLWHGGFGKYRAVLVFRVETARRG